MMCLINTIFNAWASGYINKDLYLPIADQDQAIPVIVYSSDFSKINNINNVEITMDNMIDNNVIDIKTTMSVTLK